MQGVLYVSHGTRLSEGEKEAVDFLTSIQSSIDAPLQEICFLEILPPTIEQGVTSLIEKGATKIAVVPILLLTATHAKSDIPDELVELKESYPTITFTYGKPLGIQPRIIDALVDRINEQVPNIPEEAEILLVGRGSYDPKTIEDINTIASQLSQRVNRKVDCSYLAASKPSFDDAMERIEEESKSLTIIVPYLWFNGLLIQSMKKKVADKANIVLCEHLGHHPNMKACLVDRVKESMVLPFEQEKESSPHSE
ncbi:sirohydrochlorin chelatase [Aquibacillus kalidii]|uniref:sirohydrochlorin chelatase n=1 Tax=Aquibacillus kalidii TaxID=2762597 RepID=UPI001648AA36|nr:sirohydrochlorin chelatase [Aquibacillus kalidii]